MHDDALFVIVHILGILVGWYIGRQGVWLSAYKKGVADSKEIWMQAHDESHAVMLQNVRTDRELLLQAMREQMAKASKSSTLQ